MLSLQSRLFLRAQGRTFRPRYQSTSAAPGTAEEEKPIDPRFTELGLLIKDDFAHFKEKYDSPQHPVVLAHGLMGYDELRIAGDWLPAVHYWPGIKEALQKNNIEVVTTTVPTTGTIQERAEALQEEIKTKAAGKDVNIIAHSMGGLDSRFLISRIQPAEFQIKSLTTIATPHRGSSAADIIFRGIGEDNVAALYKLLAYLKIDYGAFGQLTRKYVCEEFNPVTPNDPRVRYFSYGASAKPDMMSIFKLPHDLIEAIEGPNDGLVSVASSKWGYPDGYKGTLMGVTHLDMINRSSMRRAAARLTRTRQDFNAVAFYLAIADMLAKEGL